MQKNSNRFVTIWPLVLSLCLILASAGCVGKVMQFAGGSSAESAEPGETVTETIVPTPAAILQPEPSVPVATPVTALTPAKSEIVTDALPIVTEDPYPILHGARINSSPNYNRLERNAEFTKTYVLRENATAFIVNVVEGPLVIEYEIEPLVDCLDSPDSCRGNGGAISTSNSGDSSGEASLSTVNRPYFVCTVRNNQTHEIIAEDGYMREYSGDTSGSITVYSEGQYHVTLAGGGVDVKVSVITGESPTELDLEENGAVVTPIPTPGENPEYLI